MRETEVDAGSDLAQDVIDRHRGIQREADVQLRLGRLLTHHRRHLRLRRELRLEAGSPHCPADKFGNNRQRITTRWP
jgi:hypothetical protein